METPNAYTLGVTDHLVRVENSKENRELALSMVRQAHRTVNIYTRDLDPAVFDTKDMEEAVSRLVRASRSTLIRILVQDPTRAVKEGHHLLRLAQQLSSKIQLRVPCDDDKGYNHAFLVVDETAFLRRPVADLYAAEANFNDAFEARSLMRYFDEVWERAELDPQLRRLSL